MGIALKEISGNMMSEMMMLARKYSLTKREVEILREMALNGFSNSQLAKHFHIAESTVKNHIRNMLIKTGTTSTRELLSLIIRLKYRI